MPATRAARPRNFLPLMQTNHLSYWMVRPVNGPILSFIPCLTARSTPKKTSHRVGGRCEWWTLHDATFLWVSVVQKGEGEEVEWRATQTGCDFRDPPAKPRSIRQTRRCHCAYPHHRLLLRIGPKPD